MDKLVYDSGFGILPKRVMIDPNLSIQAKAIFAYLVTYAGNSETAYPSQRTISYQLGISKDTAGKYIRELRENGYLEIDQKREDGRFSHNVYKLIPCPKKTASIITEPVNTEHGSLATNINNNNKNNNNNINNNKYIEQMDQLWKAYPNKKGKDAAYKKIPKLLKKHSFDELMRCVERYTKETQGKDKQYIKQGSTFFNSGYVDYLDENYEETTQPSTNSMNRNKNNIPQYRTGAGANVNNTFKDFNSPEELEKYLREMQKGKGM